ncbi:MAG TPA: YraN family protein [Dehalococcoidia bacterium]|nr:YraN family protein [Dehalococcoidia bacterium]
MPDPRKQLGDFGERLAAAHLESKGYRIIDRNFSISEGELDLVAMHDDEVVFVEVRTRKGGASGQAERSVGPRKAAKVLLAARRYLDHHPALADHPLRIDVIAIELARDGTLSSVSHYEDAIRPR